MLRVISRTQLTGTTLLLLVSTVPGPAQTSTAEVRIVTPDAIQWRPVPGYPPGYERAMLEGDADKAVPITYRVRLPDGFEFAPHTHPWTEHVTVLQGTWYLGIGTSFDLKRARPLAAGSFAIIPAGVPHFVVARGETILQLHGMGPLGLAFVDQDRAPP